MVRLPGGYTFYHAGDTALFTDMQLIAEMHRPELAFVPIGDLFTMDPHQAARACRLLGVREAIPIHWGTFPPLTGTPEEFESVLRGPGQQLHRGRRCNPAKATDGAATGSPFPIPTFGRDRPRREILPAARDPHSL